MGWSTWNTYGCRIDEKLVRATADALVSSGMKAAGYEYVLIDDCWQAPQRDAQGRLQVDPKTFPSGIRALAGELHAKGLKLGIYTSAGKLTCERRPASYGKEDIDAQTFAAWGVDYVKDDLCGRFPLLNWWPWWDFRPRYEAMGRALKESEKIAGHPILFSLCPWGFGEVWTWGASVAALWRTSMDISASWRSVLHNLDSVVGKEKYASSGHWNDPDFLEIGVGGLSPDEELSHFALWAMVAAPLIAGNDLTKMPERVRAILTAPEIIAVDQDPAGLQGTLAAADGPRQVWVKKLSKPGEYAVALLNRGESETEIAASWKDIGLAPGPADVRDLWLRKDLGSFKDSFSARVPPHGVVIVKISRR